MPTRSPILNYTTTVPVEKSVAEITQILARKGARSVSQRYDENRKIVGVDFVLVINKFPIPFELPANAAGVAKVLIKAKPNADRARLTKQAELVAWRILKDWVEAQIALIESGQAEIEQVFMPYAIMGAKGETVFQQFMTGIANKQLGAGA